MRKSLPLLLIAILALTGCLGEPTGYVVLEPGYDSGPSDNTTDSTPATNNETNTQQDISKYQDLIDSLAAAEDWLKENSRYYDDSSTDPKLRMIEWVDNIGCRNCWEVNFSYSTRQATTLNQHSTVLMMRQETVVSAITDNSFDEIRKVMIVVPVQEMTQLEARELALDWMREYGETYINWGRDLNALTTRKGLCDTCWNVILTFDSIRRGYGEDAKLSDEDNPREHSTFIRIEDGRVVSAITDGVFEEWNQRFLEDVSDLSAEEDDIWDLAEDWVRDRAETYVYDGRNLELDDIDKRDCDEMEDIDGHDLADREIDDLDDCWRVRFEWESRYEGYGDRTGLDPARQDTDHEIEVWVADERIVSAITDDEYDEINERLI